MKKLIVAFVIILMLIAGSLYYKNYWNDGKWHMSYNQKIMAYTIDDLHYIIGFGRWTSDKKMFHIYSVSGQEWEIYPGADIKAAPVTPDFIPKQTR